MNEQLIRPARPDDGDFLWSMLYEAAYWRPRRARPAEAELRRDDHNARYLDGWGRPGDVALIAERVGEHIGAAWFRAFTRERHGWGFIDESTPELAIGVRADARGKGVGGALLRALIDAARDAGCDALRLSVESDNPALHLYERLGFVTVEASRGSLTMRLALESV